MSQLELAPEDVAHWDQSVRVAVDHHLERGTISEVSANDAYDSIAAAQARVHPFFIVGRALEQRRRGNDDFRVRPIDGGWEEYQQSLLAYLVAAFYEHSPTAGRPRALVVPRWMRYRLIGDAMTASLTNTLSLEPVVNASPQLLFLGVPVLGEMTEKRF